MIINEKTGVKKEIIRVGKNRNVARFYSTSPSLLSLSFVGIEPKNHSFSFSSNLDLLWRFDLDRRRGSIDSGIKDYFFLIQNKSLHLLSLDSTTIAFCFTEEPQKKRKDREREEVEDGLKDEADDLLSLCKPFSFDPVSEESSHPFFY